MKDNQSKKTNTLKDLNTSTDGSFNIKLYSDNLDEQKDFIIQKINNTEVKLKNIVSKHDTLNNMITRTALLIKDNAEKSNYNTRNQWENLYQKQIESLSFLVEMGMKYEDLIFKYQKMLLDIENHKVSSYTKIRAAEKTIKKDEESDLGELAELTKQMKSFVNVSSSGGDEVSQNIIEEAKHKLNIKGY